MSCAPRKPASIDARHSRISKDHATTMDTLGIYGFMFGMMSFVMLASLQSEVKKLRKEVEELKQLFPHP